MRLAANLSWLYPQLPWPQRFAAAAADGFEGVEILFPYEHAPAWYGDMLRAHGLELVLFNTPIEDGAGRLGLAAVAGAEAEFRRQFARALAVAEATGCPRIHCMAGATAGLDRAACDASLLHNLEYAIGLAERAGLTLTLEPLNRHDQPDYHYHRPDEAVSVLEQLDSPRLALQFDYYHCVRESLAPAPTVEAAARWIGHVQIAGAPRRDDPDLARDGLLEGIAALAACGYDGWLACEYQPATTAAAGLHWADPLRARGLLR